MSFPIQRMRRLRRTEQLRNLVRETRPGPGALIYPIFVCPGAGVRREIASMPGQFNLSIDQAVETAHLAKRAGIGGLLLFGIPESKDDAGTGGFSDDGIVQRALREIRTQVPELLLITDVCLCEYTSHGHCGVLQKGQVDNDPTLELLSATALSHARSGADMIAPSDMMDGRVGAIRRALDAEHFEQVPIMAYAAKYASGFYGPFRDAAASAPQFGDRRGYQMDPANAREAMREIELDIQEGADIVMVKPAMPYLDIVAKARARWDLPIAAYQVSGEYAMIEAAARAGWLERERVIQESLTSIFRAGADVVITYYALEAAERLR